MAGFDMVPFKNAYEGCDCVIVGNGGSLNDVPPESLSDISFATNLISKRFDDYPWRPDFYVAVSDAAGISEYSDYIIRGISEAKQHSFVSWNNRHLVKNIPNATLIAAHEYPIQWSDDVDYIVCRWGMSHLVTFQIVAYMGFRTVHLTGFDLNFRPIEDGVDPNHFTDNYWGKYQAHRQEMGRAKYEQMNRDHLAAHKIVAENCERLGITVVDHTPNGPLGDVYVRGN